MRRDLADPDTLRWPRSYLLVPVAICLALLQALVIYRDSHYGRLSGLVPWDDNAILVSALRRLTTVSASSSVDDLLRHWRDLAPHAPIADFQATVGLALSNGSFLGPYWLNAAWIFLIVILMLRALSHVSWGVALLLTVVLVSQSLSIAVLSVLKGDFKATLFLSVALLLLAEQVKTGRTGAGFVGAAALSLATLCKLTAFYMPIFACATVLIFETASFVGAGRPLRRQAVAAYLADNKWRIALQVTVAVAPFLLAFAWGARGTDNLIVYIRNALDTTWTDGLTFGQRAAIYLPGGSHAWGRLGWLFVTVVPLFVLLCVHARRHAELAGLGACLVVALMFFLPLVIARTSNPEFGSYFIGCALGATLIAVRGLAERSPAWLIATSIGVVIFAVAANIAGSSGFQTDALQESRRTYEKIVDELVALEQRPNPTVYVMFEDSIAAHPNVSLLHFLKTGRIANAYRIDRLDHQAALAEQLRGADFVVSLVPSSPDIPAGYLLSDRFPASRELSLGDARVASQPQMIRVGSFPWRNGVLNLYRNRQLTKEQRDTQ
jgi:hypothetical protein